MASGGSDAARRPEKSSFAITCSLLGKYIKEKGSLADLGLRVLDSAPSGKSEAYRPPTTMSLLSGVDASGDDSSDVKEAKEPEKAQLTMFYGGKVMVFDNFPAEKAKDLMKLASKGQTFTCATPDSVAAAATDVPKCPAVTKPPASFPAGKFSDLPIARKSSLHRFLEKRKDRISAKGPYHLSSSSGSTDDLAVKKVEISQAWLGLA